MAAAATAAAWPTVPPLQILPSAVQLPLLDVAPADVWERRHVATDGGPVVVVRVARLPGAGWRVSFALAHVDDAGDIEQPQAYALDVDTFAAARAAADFAWAFVDGAASAFARHVAAAAAAPVEPDGNGRQLLRFEPRPSLAPTG